MEPTADPLTRALMPVLLHRLANATQLITGLNAMLGLEGGEELFATRSDDLARASREVVDLGWAMAVLGSASGADLLLARREPRGLEILLSLAHEAARRSGRPLAPAPSPVPHLAPEVGEGWQLPWGIASLLVSASTEADSGESPLAWSLTPTDTGTWCLEFPAGAAIEARLAQILARLPGAEGGRGRTGMRLVLPQGWLLSTE